MKGVRDVCCVPLEKIFDAALGHVTLCTHVQSLDDDTIRMVLIQPP